VSRNQQIGLGGVAGGPTLHSEDERKIRGGERESPSWGRQPEKESKPAFTVNRKEGYFFKTEVVAKGGRDLRSEKCQTLFCVFRPTIRGGDPETTDR